MPQKLEPKLKQALARRQKSRIVDASRKLAAILVPIYYKDGEYYILFTKRTEQVTYHKGEISFPGGACEEQDETLAHTALRECAEEIGLTMGIDKLLGELDDTITISSGFIISPFVATIPWPHSFKANPTETKAIIEVPISALLDKNYWHHETSILDGQPVTSYFYHYQDNIIWGATARILNQFLDIFARVMNDTEE